MDKALAQALRPDRFDSAPNTPTASKEFNHFLKTLANYLTALPQEHLDKLQVLTNFLSPLVYDLISDATTYDSAIEVLKGVYVKSTNEVFSRHLLSVRKQQPGESLDEYLQALKTLSKDCSFKAVSAVNNCQEYIRDAFISGIKSSSIRQRLLEETTDITLTSMFEKARTLEVAQKSLESYSNQQEPLLNSIQAEENEQYQDVTINNIRQTNVRQNVTDNDTRKCFNCGNFRHPKSRCPAREVECYRCGKMGHFGKVCKSSKQPTTEDRPASKSTAASIFFPTIA